MKEEVNIYNGKGTIHLKGGPSETFLYIKKEAKMACFFAEIGTVWRYQIGRELSDNLIRENYQYEALVSQGKLNKTEQLSMQFGHVLQLLTNGRYELHYCELPISIDILPAIEKDREDVTYDIYGGMMDIVATQSYSDRPTIEKYKESIKKGARPIAVLIKLKDSCAIYILDGHHKLKAYQEMNIKPKALVISKLDYKHMEEGEALDEMKKLGMSNKEWIEIYKEEKATKAHESNFYNLYSKGLKEYFKS